jgi:N-acetylglucosamine-6-phosphate deacetylase
MASAHPAKVLKMQDKLGAIDPGKTASLLLLSDEFALRKVFVAGVEHLISIN